MGVLSHFPTENGFFTGAAKGIVTEFSCCADDAMTGDQHGNRVSGYSVAYSPGCFGLVDRDCDSLIGIYLSSRDAQQGFPDLNLKIRTSQVQAQGRFASFGGRKNLFDKGPRVSGILNQSRLLPFFVQVFQSLFFCIERDIADPTFGSGQQALSKGSRVAAKTDCKTRALMLIFSRSDRFGLDEKIMEPARTGEAGFIGHLEQAIGV